MLNYQRVDLRKNPVAEHNHIVQRAKNTHTIDRDLTVRHGKIHHAIIKFAKASISIRAIEKPWRTVNVITRLGYWLHNHHDPWGSLGIPHFFISSVVLGPLSKHSRTCQRVEIGRKGGTRGTLGPLQNSKKRNCEIRWFQSGSYMNMGYMIVTYLN